MQLELSQSQQVELAEARAILSMESYEIPGYEVGSYEQWLVYRDAGNTRDRLTNNYNHRRKKSLDSERKKYCQWCRTTPVPLPPDRLGRVRSGLSVHHIKPVHLGGGIEDGVVTLCDDCHKQAHETNGISSWKKVNQAMAECLSSLFGPSK